MCARLGIMCVAGAQCLELLMNSKKMPIADVNAAKYNPRIDLQPGDPVYEKLKKSIETFGYLQPIIVNRRSNTVVGGHQRLRVLKDLGYEEVDVVFVDLSAEHEKALNLTLNKTVGEWDESKLARLLQEFEGFPDIDVQLTGFDVGEIGDLISRVLDRETATGNDDDFDPEAALDCSRPAVTEKGELLELGDHRLLCGDATNAEDVRRLMKGQRVKGGIKPEAVLSWDGRQRTRRMSGDS